MQGWGSHCTQIHSCFCWCSSPAWTPLSECPPFPHHNDRVWGSAVRLEGLLPSGQAPEGPGERVRVFPYPRGWEQGSGGDTGLEGLDGRGQTAVVCTLTSALTLGLAESLRVQPPRQNGSRWLGEGDRRGRGIEVGEGKRRGRGWSRSCNLLQLLLSLGATVGRAGIALSSLLKL